ncbi:alpha/beta fold hydrolase [Tranquillimonas alkanivorans]|uniref:Pimeloyl-ACP methyl ester carboxylesterase n=1 Tax=Tranquillimonas alkanivorans TaxID=441119 RepID=A0A1I5RA98_9RHOB|nr:alpha/beta hydrolase [Tranquillimonas alkanivorans]SFP55267.1 Pimeloyl-ACP methyl ester carboxylesterase [Tranquillimonas alkanivorans]
MTLSRLVASALLTAALLLGGCGMIVDGRADRREIAAHTRFPPGGAFTRVNGQRVHYVQRGTGPDLVLIHGASGNTRDFTYRFLDRLANRYRVTVFDRPGLGYTDRVSDEFGGPYNTRAESPAEQAAFLAAAAEGLGIEHPIVLGHSYGGTVALAWGLNHDPAALALLAPATHPWPGGLGWVYDLASSSFGGANVVPLATAFVGQKQIDTAVRAIFYPQEPPEGYSDYVGAQLTLRRGSFRANARQVNSLRPHVVEMSKRYAELDLPVEIVHGTADDIVPLKIHSARLAQDAPGATLTKLEGIGHMVHHVAPDPVEQAIDRAARRAGLR